MVEVVEYIIMLMENQELQILEVVVVVRSEIILVALVGQVL
jgi:hypothetical protein